MTPFHSLSPLHRLGRPDVRRLTAVALACLAGVLVGLLERPEDGLWSAAAAIAIGVPGVGLTRRRMRLFERECETWLWMSLALASVTAGLAVNDVVPRAGSALDAPLRGLPFTVAALVGCQAMYQSLVRWNRFRTFASDPVDWLNGVAATVAVAAAGSLVLDGTGALAGWPVPQLQGWLLRLSTLTVLLASAVTVAALGNLVHDPRMWLVIAGLGEILLLEIVSVIVNPSSSLGGLAQAGWLIGLALLGGAALVRREASPATAATTASSTAGALVVIGGGVTILATASILDYPGVGPTVYSVLALLGAGTRAGAIVRGLSQLALTQHEARTDDLTGALNRRALMRHLTQLVTTHPVTLMVWDLDHFKEVNDRYGHQAGDRLLQEAVTRVQALLPTRALLARLGGDEFAVVLVGANPREGVRLGQALAASLADIDHLDGRPVRIGASVGIAVGEVSTLGTPPEATANEVLRRADASMYRAKRTDTRVCVYDGDADRSAQERAQLLDDLRFTLDREDLRRAELVLHYQPQLSLTSEQVVGVEALVRWLHPRFGLIPPADFLGLVEAHGLIGALTEHVLRRALHTARTWADSGRRLRMSVNLSSHSLSDPDFLAVLEDALDSSGVDPCLLTLEVTETMLMAAPDVALRTSLAIAAKGVSLSIDDYGTGYSSLAYLNDLPAGELKIDRSFVARLTSDARTAAIVGATIELGHRLGQRIVAEGVEDADTMHALRRLHCDEVQGFHISRPLPRAELDLWFDIREGAAAAGQLRPCGDAQRPLTRQGP